MRRQRPEAVQRQAGRGAGKKRWNTCRWSPHAYCRTSGDDCLRIVLPSWGTATLAQPSENPSRTAGTETPGSPGRRRVTPAVRQRASWRRVHRSVRRCATNNKLRRRGFDQAASGVGLAGLTPHELRHTAASLAVDKLAVRYEAAAHLAATTTGSDRLELLQRRCGVEDEELQWDQQRRPAARRPREPARG
jgi:hypothetical protein